MDQPARIGRFVVLRKLGEGGMGVVFAAYDEELERKLAIKLLLPGLRSERQSLGETRLLREAQALARVSHPNVVQVYEVGSVGEAVYIAMELVRGKSLGEWLAARARGWRDVLGVFLQAGAGLAAAHAAGVVHRDIKPDNLLVGDDGRVRVLDFSLARPPAPVAADEAGDPDRPDQADQLGRTRAGALIGTPLYMSPEQLQGQPADERSDQFSFCVAMYEALYRVRPFAGTTLDELRNSVIRGQIRGSRGRGLLRSLRSGDNLSRRSGHEAARRVGESGAAEPGAAGELSGGPGNAVDVPAGAEPGATAPAWLRRVLLRGLAIDPALRHPSMTALLAELGRDPDRVRRRVVAGLAITAVLAVGVGASLYLADEHTRACSSAAGELVGVWGPTRREAAQRAVLATGVPFAATTWARVAALLDARASDWVTARTAACLEARGLDDDARGEQALPLLARRDACLDARLHELDALAQVLTEARPDTVERAVAAAANLRPLATCSDEAALLARVPAPGDPQLAAAVEDLRRRLARVLALERAGDFKAALAEAEAVHTAALALGHPPVVAEAALARGRAALALTRLEESAAQLEAAYHTASQIGHDEVVTAAAVELVAATRELARLDVAETWARLAEDALIRGGRPPALTAAWLQTRSRIASERGRPSEALALAEEALALRQAAQGDDHPDVAQAHNSLGLALHGLDRDLEALAAYASGLAICERVLGVDHPSAVPLLNNRGAALSALGRFDEALASYRRGLEIRARVYGTAHPRYAFSLAQIGDALTNQGKYGEAAEYLQQALAIRTRALGPDHPEVGDTLIGIGKLEFLRGDHDAALRATQRALVVLTRAHGPDSTRVGSVKMNLAVMYRQQKQYAQALALNAEVRALYEKTLPPGHAKLLSVRGNTANVLRELGRHDQAIAEYRQLLALQESGGLAPANLVGTLLGLGLTHLVRGAPTEAVGPLERALKLSAAGEDPFLRAQVELALARALWASKQDRPRARKLAEATAAGLRAAGTDGAELLREVEAWLADPNKPAE